MTDESAEKPAEMTQPVVIDLGKQKARKLKDLKAGSGPLWEDMLAVVDEVREVLGEEAAGKIFVPVVMIYQKKSKRPRLDQIMLPKFR